MKVLYLHVAIILAAIAIIVTFFCINISLGISIPKRIKGFGENNLIFPKG